MAAWLTLLEARVAGLALDPNEDQPLYASLGLAKLLIADHRIDIRDWESVAQVVEREQPEFVFHLAAQPLVRQAYSEPAETFETNVLGVTNLLEALRRMGRPCVIVVATTDKCYENRHTDEGYHEDDRLGGRDPYSASKACAELVVASYRQSFFADCRQVKLASARAGNVIGGGDWSRDRIVPDAIRALRRGEPIRVRNIRSTRPWQHVLEPLSGYLWLAATMARPDLVEQPDARRLCGAFNFGPLKESHRAVAQLVEELLTHIPGSWTDAPEAAASHEAGKLHLAIDKARELLAWRPAWDFAEAVRATAAWYQAEQQGENLWRTTHEQICDYQVAARAAGIPWIGQCEFLLPAQQALSVRTL
ncbi:MAG: CDP-glucose 4,6-dehydratase [Planctomycetes bacterium]|nr:CDP-glucose 4,6-dehydratase [Planctomycetota bacterium]